MFAEYDTLFCDGVIVRGADSSTESALAGDV